MELGERRNPGNRAIPKPSDHRILAGDPKQITRLETRKWDILAFSKALEVAISGLTGAADDGLLSLPHQLFTLLGRVEAE